MKKDLTINKIALGNLKQRRRQYAVMIIGIVLAMVFSSSVIFMLSTMSNSIDKLRSERIGYQSVLWRGADENEIEKAKENKVLGKSGYAHVLGSLKSTDETFCEDIKVAWLDDNAALLANPVLIEGNMPAAENEIAIEKLSLAKLGKNDAKIGDEITFNLYPQNGEETLKESRQATYKLVGILKNKATNLDIKSSERDWYVPSAFVAPNTQIDVGGKENLVCYARYYSDRETNKDMVNLDNFVESLGYGHAYEKLEHFTDESAFSSANVNENIHSVRSDSENMIVVIVVMMIASCLVIVNSFNSNLNERKKQIGMFRAIGATKRQIRHIFAREALIIALIATPVSCLISAVAVKAIVHFMGDMFVFKLNVWAVISAVIFCILCVMVSASIPLFSASRITPIQSIRNIENTRKFNKKKIKSKSKFDVPSLLAKRSLTFGKLKQVTVSVMLIITIVGSGFLMSSYTYEMNDIRTIKNDYRVEAEYSYYGTGYVNYSNSNLGFTEQDKRFVEDNKYIESGSGVKSCEVNLLMPSDTSDYRMEMSNNYEGSPYYYSGNSGFSGILDETNYREHLYSKRRDTPDIRKMQELLKTNDFIKTSLVACDADYLKSLEKYVYDGKIDIEKINSGEEIILFAPKKIGFFQRIDEEGRVITSGFHINEEVDMYDCIFTAESDFHAGEEIEIAILTADKQTGTGMDSISRTIIPDDTKVMKKKVKIGAVVSSTDELSRTDVLFSALTSLPAINSIIPSLKYDSLTFNLNTPCNDEIDSLVMEDINYISSGFEYGHIYSKYGDAKEDTSDINKVIGTMMSVIILLFVISLSIINNTITSDIKNSKSKIGTLRAVGADEKTIVKSYILKLISMLGYGSVIGLAAFFGGYGISYMIHLANNKKHMVNSDFILTLDPSAAIIFIILAFIICSLNLWLKVRKEMKNSIVENIREL